MDDEPPASRMLMGIRSVLLGSEASHTVLLIQRLR